MINIVKVFHDHAFSKTFFLYKIVKTFVKLNAGLVAEIQLTRKELSRPSEFS